LLEKEESKELQVTQDRMVPRVSVDWMEVQEVQVSRERREIEGILAPLVLPVLQDELQREELWIHVNRVLQDLREAPVIQAQMDYLDYLEIVDYLDHLESLDFVDLLVGKELIAFLETKAPKGYRVCQH